MGWEDPLDEEVATHSSILAGKIQWTEESGRLQSTGSQKKYGMTKHTHTQEGNIRALNQMLDLSKHRFVRLGRLHAMKLTLWEYFK